MSRIMRDIPDAQAKLSGAPSNTDILGYVSFYQLQHGVLVMAEVFNLPVGSDCNQGIFGFHIHEGDSCTGNQSDPFADAKTHYNPKGCSHPFHSGDLPPLFGNNGYAYMTFLTNRFTADEIIGKTIVIHDKPDDFTTQPSGNSGNKIACGVILPL